jgi:DNA-binding MarR family transcriptional regulator
VRKTGQEIDLKATETFIRTMAAFQSAFGKRVPKGDKFAFLTVLQLADGEAGTTQEAIRKALRFTQTKGSRLTGVLKQAKWIDLRPSKSDRRESVITTTKQGKELLSKLEADLVAILCEHKAAGPSRKLKTKGPSLSAGPNLWDPIEEADGDESSTTPANESQQHETAASEKE